MSHVSFVRTSHFTIVVLDFHFKLNFVYRTSIKIEWAMEAIEYLTFKWDMKNSTARESERIYYDIFLCLIHIIQNLLYSISTSIMVLTNMSSKVWQNMENPILKCTATCYDFIGREWSCSFLIQNTRHRRKIMIHRFLTKTIK